MSEYLEFVQVWNEGDTRTTKIFEVRPKKPGLRLGDSLGDIEWFSRWRQYAFVPAEETVFNPDCLDDISKFIRNLMQKRKVKA